MTPQPLKVHIRRTPRGSTVTLRAGSRHVASLGSIKAHVLRVTPSLARAQAGQRLLAALDQLRFAAPVECERLLASLWRRL